jgi:hypothetical protein
MSTDASTAQEFIFELKYTACSEQEVRKTCHQRQNGFWLVSCLLASEVDLQSFVRHEVDHESFSETFRGFQDSPSPDGFVSLESQSSEKCRVDVMTTYLSS